jgi:lysophospholipase L1-like esterase
MRFCAPAEDIAQGVEILGSLIISSDAGPGGKPPKLLIIAPAPVIEVGQYAAAFAGGAAKSAAFSRCYREVAELLDCLFLDAGSIISSSPVDGIHLDADAHRILGEAIAALL